MVQQTIKNGTRVTFMIKGMTSEFVRTLDFEISESSFIKNYGNKICVAHFTTATQLGERDHEYYDITFDNGDIIGAVSGHHLHDIPWRFNKQK